MDVIKNVVILDMCGILEVFVVKCFVCFGNMGCLIVFVNYVECFVEIREVV